MSGGGIKCCYIGCSSNTRKNPEKHFFCFPVNNRERCRQWMINSGNNDFADLPDSILKNRRVCGDHFGPGSFVNELNARLNRNAVPNPHFGPIESNEKNATKETEGADPLAPTTTPFEQHGSLQSLQLQLQQKLHQTNQQEERPSISSVFIKEEPVDPPPMDHFIPMVQIHDELPQPSQVTPHHFMDRRQVEPIGPQGPQQPTQTDQTPRHLKRGPQDNVLKINDAIQASTSSFNSGVPRKKFKRGSDFPKTELVSKVLGILEKKEDEFDVFGRNVAAKLRKMQSNQGIYAEKLITDILCQGLLQKLQENSTINHPPPPAERSACPTTTENTSVD